MKILLTVAAACLLTGLAISAPVVIPAIVLLGGVVMECGRRK